MMEDELIVTYDDDPNVPAIAIARKDGKYGITILRMHVGKSAEDLYRILTDQSVKFEIVED